MDASKQPACVRPVFALDRLRCKADTGQPCQNNGFGVQSHRSSICTFLKSVQNRAVTGVSKKYPLFFLLTRSPKTSNHAITQSLNHYPAQNATFTPTVKLRPINGAAVLMNEVWEYAKRSVRLLPLM